MHVGGQQKSHRYLFHRISENLFYRIYTPTSAPLKTTWIHKAKDESKWNALPSDWWESLDDEDDA
jgi:hypothetical protein